MEAAEFLKIMHVAERLKDNTRHSWTSGGRHESVAEHSWRLAMMAYFVRDEFPRADMDKVIRMCLFHDMGEAFTGDIPAFLKSEAHEREESRVLADWVASLPEPYRGELRELFAEMEALQTEEARIYKALDKMEALIQHDEADIATWLPLEYELNLTYGTEQVQFSEYMKKLKEEIDRATRAKIEEAAVASHSSTLQAGNITSVKENGNECELYQITIR